MVWGDAGHFEGTVGCFGGATGILGGSLGGAAAEQFGGAGNEPRQDIAGQRDTTEQGGGMLWVWVGGPWVSPKFLIAPPDPLCVSSVVPPRFPPQGRTRSRDASAPPTSSSSPILRPSAGTWGGISWTPSEVGPHPQFGGPGGVLGVPPSYFWVSQSCPREVLWDFRGP